MKLTFYLLDINYEVINGRPEVRLWGVDPRGKSLLLVDSEYRSSFYILVKGEERLSSVLKEVNASSDGAGVVRAEAADRRYFGRPVPTIRVTLRSPEMTVKAVRQLGKIPGVEAILEDDLRYTTAYLLDSGAVPCRWHEAEAEEIKAPAGVDVDKVYRLHGLPGVIEKIEPPPLRILCFSMICYSPIGTANPEINPVIVLSTVSNEGDYKQFIAKESAAGIDDRPVIEGLSRTISDLSPDLIIGFGSNAKDIPYLLHRAKRLGIPLAIDRACGGPHTSLYGHMSITGRAHLDLYNIAEDMQEIKLKTLRNMAEFLGIKEAGGGRWIEEHEVAAYWDDKKKRGELLDFSSKAAGCILQVTDLVFDYAAELAGIVGIPIDHVCTAAFGFRVEAYLMRQARRLGEVIPKRIERPYIPYAGAIVLPPKPGVHENVAVLDFRSMYPNIMILYNVSPDTYAKKGEKGVDYNIAPEVGHRFRKEPAGFYKRALSDLIDTRRHIQLILKRLKPGERRYRIIDARQRAVKIITNACYGYAGWTGARWYMKPVAEATAAWGRQTITETLGMAEKAGIDIIYGDTDSIFVRYDRKKVEPLIRKIEKRLGLEVRPDKVYRKILFSEAKKRYAGLLPDGGLDIVGLEVVRGDWTHIAREVQERVIEKVLKEGSPENGAAYVKGRISDLDAGRVSLHDLVIWKTLTKSVEEYEANAPHVEAAKRLQERGFKLNLGDKVGYVIVKGEGKLYQRAMPYTMVTIDKVDREYYITNQILPAALRILEGFGISEEDLH